ncbi:MAG: Asp-tRNA(Asn)/Glu-tRNA(Gln) amidotransferase subunit GatC [Nanoarchaeota archaeon]
MKISEDVVKKVALLARLSISSAEAKEFAQQLKEVVDAFSILGKVDVGKTMPLFHPVPLSDVLRDDILKSKTKREKSTLTKELASLPNQFVILAPHAKESYVKGPRAME